MTPLLRRFRKDRSGATAIEYGLIASFVGTALIAGLALLSPEITAVFERITTALTPLG
jgi:pilus assembly protein Flp/PilA